MNTNSSQVYLRYFRLGETAYREKVRFYEENPEALSELYFDDRLEIDIDYLLCLFEVGRYERYLTRVDKLIETIIIENIYKFREENIYHELLFRKSACLYQTQQYHKSKDILKQLINMERSNPLYIGLYTICNRKMKNDIYTTVRASAILAFLIVAGISIARIFLEPFMDVHLSPFILLRSVLLVYGVICMIGLELAFQYRIYRETGMYSHSLLNRVFGTKV